MHLLQHSVIRAAKKNPEHPAFRYKDETLSYGMLDSKSNQLANYLIKNGIGKSDRIGILLPRCIDIPVAIYGILKAGCVFVPLDPQAPKSRLDFVLKDCGIEWIITDMRTEQKYHSVLAADDSSRNIILQSTDKEQGPIHHWTEVYKENTTLPVVNILADDLAYIMYTSGTTGQPKGIMHTHYSGLSYAMLSAELFGVTPDDKLGNHSALHFDISTMGYLTMPYAGGTTVIIPDAHLSFPASLTQLMEDEQLTIWYSVPLALTQMLRLGALDHRKLDSIRWVLFGGEPFSPKILKAISELWQQATFSNIYGPAEVNQCTYHHVTKPINTEEAIPIGTVWDNTEIMILDESNNDVAPGDSGELLVRSATRMKGYWNQPGMTEQKFYIIEDIVGIRKTFYRTGDIVSRDKNGILHFHGRADRQIKVRGYRVELEEVQANILEHPKIKDAAVFSYGFEDQNRIEAVVISDGLESSEILKYLKSKLPKYALPEHIQLVSKIPRTSAGKIDFKHILKSRKNEG